MKPLNFWSNPQRERSRPVNPIKSAKKLIQRIRCAIPFSPYSFHHKNIEIVRGLSRQSDLIRCVDCGREFAMNHSVKVILPFEYVKQFHHEMFPEFEQPSAQKEPPCSTAK